MTTTMTVDAITSNPFTLMMDPDAVFRAVAQSDRLARLSSRICRPLDKPLVAKVEDAVAGDELAGELDLDGDVDGVVDLSDLDLPGIEIE